MTLPDRREKKGSFMDRRQGEPRHIHRADDIKTKWQFFAFAMTFFAKHWLKVILLVMILGVISFVILRYTDFVDIFGGGK
jgi:hypothetical protein